MALENICKTPYNILFTWRHKMADSHTANFFCHRFTRNDYCSLGGRKLNCIAMSLSRLRTTAERLRSAFLSMLALVGKNVDGMKLGIQNARDVWNAIFEFWLCIDLTFRGSLDGSILKDSLIILPYICLDFLKIGSTILFLLLELELSYY